MKTKKVLIIEDNNLDRSLFENLIGQKWRFKSAKNGLIGIELLGQEKYDLVLLAVELPIMDGITIFKKIQADSLDQYPIIAVTTSVDSLEKKQLLEIGFSGVCVKPIKSQVLVEQLDGFLSKQDESSFKRNEDSKEIIDKLILEQLIRLNGPGKIKPIYHEFLVEFDELFELTVQGFYEGDLELVKSSLHVIKGNSGTLGLNQIYSLSAEAEDLTFNNRLSLLEGVLKRLSKSREEVEIYLQDESIFTI